jgi:hypothetical protein
MLIVRSGMGTVERRCLATKRGCVVDIVDGEDALRGIEMLELEGHVLDAMDSVDWFGTVISSCFFVVYVRWWSVW